MSLSFKDGAPCPPLPAMVPEWARGPDVITDAPPSVLKSPGLDNKDPGPPPPPTPTPRRCPEPSQLSPWVQTFLLFAHPTLQGQGSQHIATWFNTRASGNGLLWTTPWTRGCVPRVTGAVCPGGQTPQRGRPFRGFPTHQWCRHLGRRAHPGLGLASGKAQLARLDPTPHSPRKSTKSKASAPSSP